MHSARKILCEETEIKLFVLVNLFTLLIILQSSMVYGYRQHPHSPKSFWKLV